MGVNNRARRAAKARQRAKQRPQRIASRPSDAHDERAALHLDDSARARDALTEIWNECEANLHRTLVAIWGGGWQPIELVREIRRSTNGPGSTELLRRLIAVDNARREPVTLHPRWRSQIDSLDLPEVPPGVGWLANAVRSDADPRDTAAITLLTTLSGLTRLPRLIPPPGGAPSDVDIDLAGDTDSSVDDDDPVLTRVRALLAQAESTTYPAEAEAFTAKAHALMTRHAIDAALLDQSVGDGWTTALRIPIEDPYVDSKSLLLHVVAEHSRCRAVFHSRYAMCTVVGANGDVAATELLFTSLLLQAQQALLAEGDQVGAGALERSRSFRSAFLFAYANRIGERLAEVNAAVIAEADTASSRSVLPMLAHRSQVVDEAFDRLFGNLVSQRVRSGWNAAGWSSGRRAADRARLGEPDLPAGAGTPAVPPAAPGQLAFGP
jgi:Protein of unknown function (DUF2786)